MSTGTIPPQEVYPTFARLLEQLGDVPSDRIYLCPPPGTATEGDLIAANAPKDRRCELVDGTLVHKAAGFYAGALQAQLAAPLVTAAVDRKRGIVVCGAAFRCRPGTVRLPDVAFVSWDRMPNGIPREEISGLVPDFIIDTHRLGNTSAEMARRRRDYFAAGVPLVWSIFPAERTLTAYTGPDTLVSLSPDNPATVGDLIPGYSLTLRPLLDDLDEMLSNRGGRRRPT